MEPVAIPLKQKYRVGFSSRWKSKSDNQRNKPKRLKLTSQAKAKLPPVPECVVVLNAKTGAMRVVKTGRILQHTGTGFKVV